MMSIYQLEVEFGYSKLHIQLFISKRVLYVLILLSFLALYFIIKG